VATNKRRAETEPLRNWADRIARRRGKRVAMVALARKLSGILYAMWRDGSAYDPAKLRGVGGRAAVKAA
jgi:transposase